MLILLPPSEGKTAPHDGPPLDLELLSHPELTGIRRRVLSALITASHEGPAALGLPEAMAERVAANTRLETSPTAPAARVYTGVLYAAAGLAELRGQARVRAADHVRIASALFGILSTEDPIPAYRLPPAAKLPGIGAPVTALAAETSPVMAGLGADLVVDCRSGPYTRLWRPRPPTHWVTVRVVELRAGVATVVRTTPSTPGGCSRATCYPAAALSRAPRRSWPMRPRN